MNYSDRHKLIWWAPVRTASRATRSVLRHLDFVDGVTGRYLFLHAHTHQLAIPGGKEGYDLICNVRNPFLRMPSIYVWSKEKMPFVDWLETATHDWIQFDRSLHGKRFRMIRTEHMIDDLQAIEPIREALEEPDALRDFDYWIRKNRFASVADASAFYQEPTTLDAVRRLCRDQFEMFGYSTRFEAAA